MFDRLSFNLRQWLPERHSGAEVSLDGSQQPCLYDDHPTDGSTVSDRGKPAINGERPRMHGNGHLRAACRGAEG
jgi:hypothetical protein